MKLLFLLLSCGFGYVFGQEISNYAASNRLFTTAVYKEISAKDGNVLVCPVSAQIILSLALAGAGQKTAEELSRALYLPKEPEKIATIMSPLIKSLDTARHVQLSSANKMFLGDTIEVKPTFVKFAIQNYGSEVEKLNFANSAKAVDSINKWVESKTNNKIRDILSTNQVNKDTRLVLVNALYFRGKWEYPFEPYETKKMLFYNTPETKTEVDMMGLNTDLFYAENEELDAKFLKLPYENNEVSMIIVLPNKKDGLRSLETRIEKVLQPQNFTEAKVYAQIPKFTTEAKVEFVPIFENWGVADAFNNRANFKNISDSDLRISEIVQKTFIDVNEAGTEAAAATAVVLTDRIATRAIPFLADHPFVYFIQMKSGEILFIGRKCV